VFGEGVIGPRVVRATLDELGKLQYKLINEWSFDVQQALPFRAKKRMKRDGALRLFLTGAT